MSSSAENASPKSRMKDVRQNTVFASEPPPPSKARASLRRTLTQLRGVQKAKKAFLNNRIVRKYLPHGPTYLDQDASEKVKRTRTAQCVLLPHSKMYIAWDILVSFLVVWNIFYLPIAIAFPDDLHMFLEENKEYLPIRFKIGTCEDDDDSACLYYIDSIIDFISDTVFIADIIICCRTVIIEEVKGRTVEIHGQKTSLVTARACVCLFVCVSVCRQAVMASRLRVVLALVVFHGPLAIVGLAIN